MEFGTREGAIVDVKAERLWLYSPGEEIPHCESLAPIPFDSCPGFKLNCCARKDAVARAGLD
ncbi:hypothetical protein JG688_00017910 [Phytophthora aleatoria]|uniref:Uncharacterized protein n=1 Tax=Phytophthora aleatoria TaxID=2496075 RepID=A0A8J5M0Z9_9STRA|nr:hypothetical protein JG688_00017910 [Phytophthora aleatoria]